MANETVIVQAGSVHLPADMQQKLNLKDGARLTVSVRDGGIFLAREVEQANPDLANEALQRLQQGFSKLAGAGDPLRELRKEWEMRLERLSA